MKKLGIILVLVIALLVALLMTAPGRALHLLPLPNGIAIYGVQGSLWQGEAGLVSLELPDSPQPLQLHDVRWDLSGWALLTGQLKIDLELPPSSINGEQNIASGTLTLQAGRGGVAIKNADLSGDIERAVRTFNIPAPLTIAGRWETQIDDFSPAGGQDLCRSMTAAATGRDIALQVNRQWHELDDYQVNLGCSDGFMVATMDGRNMMGLVLDARFNRASAELMGSLVPTANAPEAITELLVFVGKKDSAGKYPFQIKL